MAGKGRKLSQAELEQDEVALTLQELIESVKANRVKILTIAAAAALIVIIVLGYNSYRERVRFESSQILNQANSLFLEIPRMVDDADREKRLQETIGALQTLIDRYADSPAAKEALYLQGNCYYYMDKPEKAQEIFQTFINQSKTNEEKANGEIALGYALENQFYLGNQRERIEEANKHYLTAQQLAPPKSYLYYFALMAQARILELTMHEKEALDIYSRVVAERPSPIIGAEDGDPNAPPDFSGGLAEFARKQVTQQMSQLSLFTTARLHKDRLEAQIAAAEKTVVVKAGGQEAPASSPAAQPQADATTPTAASAAPPA